MWRTSHVIAALAGLSLISPQAPRSAGPAYTEWSAPVNLGAPLNTAQWDEAFPAVSKDGLSLYMTSNRPGGSGGYDIWVSQRDSENEPWGTPMNLGPVVNSAAFDASPALSRDGHWLFFHTNRPGGRGGFDLMASWRRYTRDDFGWETPIFLAEVNSTLDDAFPAYFEEEESGVAELYFSSIRTGGVGLVDIYVSRFGSDGALGAPELVPELCSASLDFGAEISHNGREMFFLSNRPGSTGLSDLWVSTRPSVDDPWTTPVNLEVLNTAYGEAGPAISSDNMTLIFNSNWETGGKSADLYVTTRSHITGRRER